MIAAVGSELAIVFHNSLLATLVPARRIGRLSALSWAVGSAGGLAAMGLVLLLFLGTGPIGANGGGFAPLIALDLGSHQAARLTGPVVAAWFCAFVIPMFIFVPDQKGSGLSPWQAVRQSSGVFAANFRRPTVERDLVYFLAANLLYSDGIVALVAFGGIYAGGTFGWNSAQLTMFGIALTLASGFGALLSGWLDDRFGSRRVIFVCLVVLIVGTLGVLGATQRTALFVFPVTPPESGSVLPSVGELSFLGFALLIGLAAGPCQSASRTLLIRLSPIECLARNFGFFAMSGRLTAFIGPFLIAGITAATGSQRLGLAVVLPLFVCGLFILTRLRVGWPVEAEPSRSKFAQ